MFTARDISFLQTIGEGAFGRVVLVQLKEDVFDGYALLACKLIKKNFMIETRTVEHVKREIDIMNQLYGHPFFPRLYSVFEYYDRLCLLMEFCGGGDMFRWIRQSQGLSYDAVRFYGAEIVLALQKLHSLHILYRDLKSENVMLTSNGHIKLVDFGLSIRTESKAWMLVGTTECISPEVLMSQGYGPEADLWSLGILLYEMVCCKTPFRKSEDTPDDDIKKSILETQPFFDACLDSDYVDLIKGLLVKDPNSRLGHGGIEDIMAHPFFSGIDWVEVEKQNVQPPVAPGVCFEGDLCQFDYYRESIASFDTPPMSVLVKGNPELMALFPNA